MEAIATIYKAAFAELNASQKQQAIEIIRLQNNSESNPWWAETTTDDCKSMLEDEYGIEDAEIYWSGFSSQGDGASISTDRNINIEKFLRKCRVWSKFRSLHRSIAENEIEMSITRSGHRYYHSNMVKGEVSFNWGVDYTPVQEAASEELESFLTDKIRELSDTLYRELEKENDYQYSDKAITETIEANDYHFKIVDGEVTELA